jgi:hypothetical protein
MPDTTQDAIVQHLMGGTPDMPMTPPTFGQRLDAFGSQQPGTIDDRRNNPIDPYTAMKALNWIAMYPLRRDLGLDRFDMHLPEPRLPRQPGALPGQAGLYDIKRAP